MTETADAPDILLYTSNTMNGWKPLIFLHEAEIDYELRAISFDKREQKEPWFLALNPNGRIPVIVDRGEDDFAVFESGAILWRLAEKYGKFLAGDAKLRSETMQWMYFQVGHTGPSMGQAMYFQRIAPGHGETHPYAIDRFKKESRRVLEVLNARLEGREWLVGDAYSIADMMHYPWARTYPWANLSVAGLPHLQAWFDRIDARAKTQAALQLPEPRPAYFGHGDLEAAAALNAARFKNN